MMHRDNNRRHINPIISTQPSGSGISSSFQCDPSSSRSTLRGNPNLNVAAAARVLNVFDDQFLLNLQNVSICPRDEHDLAGLGIGQSHPWHVPSAIGSSNGFAGSDSSAPLSPNSTSQHSSDPKRRHFNNGNGQFSRFSRNQGNMQIRGNSNNNGFSNSMGGNQRHRFGSSNSGNGMTSSSSSSSASASSNIPQSSQIVKQNENYHPGMRDLTYWLKKLRLHKYTPLFDSMQYEEMLAINAETLERMKVTMGARKKILQSIEKLRQRPTMLKTMEQKLLNREQCIRCAICTIRQVLWSPFIKYEGKRRQQQQSIIDGICVPLSMVSDENVPALIYRVVECLNSIIFPPNAITDDLEDEYLLTMFQIFDSISKNEQFTSTHQRKALLMKKVARNYASPEEMRKHRMGMVSSSQCERCHHQEVVSRERVIEKKERDARLARGEHVSMPPEFPNYLESMKRETMGQIFNFAPHQTTKPTATVLPQLAVQPRVQQKRPASDEQSTIATSSMPKMSLLNDVDMFQSFIDNNSRLFSQAAADNNLPLFGNPSTSMTSSTSFAYPEYRSPLHVPNQPLFNESIQKKPEEQKGTYSTVMAHPSFDFDLLNVLRQSLAETQCAGTGLKNKANSTGSGYSSSDSESSAGVSPRSRSASEDQEASKPSSLDQMMTSSKNPAQNVKKMGFEFEF